MTRSTTPNRALAEAMAAAGMSNNGLARRVCDVARRAGRSLSTDHVTVKRWLDGVQPKDETARFIATAMSEALRRPISPAALGLTAALGEPTASTVTLRPTVEYPADTDHAADALGSTAAADVEGTSLQRLRAFDPHAAPSVISGYLFGDGYDSQGGSDGDVDANAIRLTTARLMELDFQLGGGHVRDLLLFYFRSKVLPHLGALPPGHQRRDFLAAVAELTQMLGWSAYDAGRHGAAQRYFVNGLRLAREAGDDLLGARLLSNLSHQANYLGHFTNAAQLARAAQTAALRASSSTTSAMLLAMEARALASLGDHRGCAAVLSRAEAALHRGETSNDPLWISYFDHAELAGESAHCYRDLRRPVETRSFAELAVAPGATPPRTRSFITMVTAMGALHGGHLDEAVATARQAVQLSNGLRSNRYRRYVADFVQAAVNLHPRESRVVDLVLFTAPVLGGDSPNEQSWPAGNRP